MCLLAIGGIVSAVGALASASAQASAYNAQAKYAERQAKLEREKGAYDSARVADANDRQLAQARGSYLSSGIALEGSAVDVLQANATEASLDEQAIRFGSEIRADNYTFEAGMARANARSARTGGILGAAGSVIGGISNQMQASANRTMIRNPYSF